jgi:putative hemolysin
MFIVEWIFDKMGYTKKIDWTSRFLAWEDVKKTCPKFEEKIVPVKKVATKRKTTAKKSVRKKA